MLYKSHPSQAIHARQAGQSALQRHLRQFSFIFQRESWRAREYQLWRADAWKCLGDERTEGRERTAFLFHFYALQFWNQTYTPHTSHLIEPHLMSPSSISISSPQPTHPHYSQSLQLSFQFRPFPREFYHLVFDCMSAEFSFKILLVGNLGVGKSSLLLRYAEGSFQEGFLPTVGVDFKIRTVQHAGKDLLLQLWDNANQSPLPSACYRRAHGLMVVFDLTDRQSFLEVRGWLQDAQQRGSCDAVRVLVGNKCDLQERSVEYSEAQSLSKSEGMAYFQVSARININIEEVFCHFANQMKQRFSEPYIAKYKQTQSYLLPLTAPAKPRSSCF